MKLTTSQLLFSFFLMALTALPVCAALPISSSTPFAAVAFTVHNFSNNDDPNNGLTPMGYGGGRNYSASGSGANQICVFCHTPHNASSAAPLWNKVYPSGLESSYRLYTSSPTLSSVAKGATITANSVSLLCMSCHDGKTAINVLHSSTYRDSSTAGGDANIEIGGESNWPIIGTNGLMNLPNLGAVRNTSNALTIDGDDGNNFTDDHPIGFSYAAAATEKSGQLKPTPDAGIRLFNGRIECSSCHDPHVYYGGGLNGANRINLYNTGSYPGLVDASAEQKERSPFLSVSNKGSKLCLSCHIK